MVAGRLGIFLSKILRYYAKPKMSPIELPLLPLSLTQPPFTFSQSIKETSEPCVKYVQS